MQASRQKLLGLYKVWRFVRGHKQFTAGVDRAQSKTFGVPGCVDTLVTSQEQYLIRKKRKLS